MSNIPLRLRAALPLGLLLAWQAASAQPEALRAESVSAPVTVEGLNAKIEEVQALGDLPEETRTELTEHYHRALSHLEEANANAAAAQAFARAAESAPVEARRVREQIERVTPSEPSRDSDVIADAPLPEVEQLLVAEKANLAAVEAKLGQLNKQLEIQALRPTEVRQRLTAVRQLQEQLVAARQQAVPSDESPLMTEAKYWVLQARAQALSAELRMLDHELLSQPARVDLLKAQRDQAAGSAERLTARVRLIEEGVAHRRRAEAAAAQAEAQETQRRASGKHPLVQALADQNAALSEELGDMAARLEAVTAQENVATESAKKVEENFRSARQKVEIAGLSHALGKVLLEQSRDLPDARFFRRETRERERRIAESGLRQIRHDEERRQLHSIGGYVDTLIAELPLTEQARLRGELERLARSRRDLLDRAIATDDAYLQALGELDFAQRRLLDNVEAYERFLDSRLLWIRTAPPPNLEILMGTVREAAMLLQPQHWQQVLGALSAPGAQVFILVLGLLFFGVVTWESGRLRAFMHAGGKSVGRIRSDRFANTVQALGVTLLLATPWPLLAFAVGMQLRLVDEPGDFTLAVSAGLVWLAPPLFYLNAFRVMCEPRGLAAAHFRWPEASLALLRRQLRWLMIVFLPATFVAVVLITFDVTTLGGGLGRVAFVVMMIALSMFFYRVLDPENGVLRDFYASQPSSALTRLRHVLFALSIAIPLALALLSLIGYLYTAGTLAGRLLDTDWFLLVLFVIHQMVVRWLLLTRRRLALQSALERRDAQRAARKAEEEAEQAAGDVSPAQLEASVIDFVALSDDTRKLLNTALVVAAVIGLWLIWAEVLPAFAILEEVTLWYHTGVVAGEERQMPITLADVGLAILISIIGYGAAKRLPALLEIVLLQRLNITAGGRYAVTTLSRYVIAAASVMLVVNIMGGSWSQLQWLVAALGVGIGFGLQEIVANFISGIIMLFERPVRVGDIVTVGDTDGVVTRIRIRATTIRNWDQQELLVPNKEFVTGRLLNWTLSDPVTRIVVAVGIAYGSDVRKAMELASEAADEHERVLKEPKPTVIFNGFGDNSLNLTLRCFIDSIEARMPAVSDLHQAINDKFNAAGIVIAFPQRDVHLDTTGPLDVRIRRERPAATGEAG